MSIPTAGVDGARVSLLKIFFLLSLSLSGVVVVVVVDISQFPDLRSWRLARVHTRVTDDIHAFRKALGLLCQMLPLNAL